MFLKALFGLLLISPMSLAADYSIFEIHKTLPMENNEPAFKDYYVNAGGESGIKKGMYLNVIRNSSVLDPAKNSNQGSLKIQIAKLHIIQVDKHISVGRLVTQTSNDERPGVDYEGIMIGDVLDIDSASMEAPVAVKAKRKTASADIDQETDEDLPPIKFAPVKQAEKAVVPALTAPAASTNKSLAVPTNIVPSANKEAEPAQKPQAESKAAEMVKLAVPPPAPQSNLNTEKKNEKVL